MITGFAHAKLNLLLHVTGRRADGYHLLQSLAVFTELADRLTVTAAPRFTLEICGEHAATLQAEAPERNLVWRAAMLIAEHCGIAQPAAHITLEKRIPLGAGLGGGSAGAACALRLLNQWWNAGLQDADLHRLAGGLGSDVPACLHATPVWMEDVGNHLKRTALNAPWWVVLAHPRKPLLSKDVYAAYRYDPRPPLTLRSSYDAAALLELCRRTRNDLTDAAITLLPETGALLRDIAAQPGCLLSRMSGSGSACFGLFHTEAEAILASQCLHRQYPQSWTAVTRIRANE